MPRKAAAAPASSKKETELKKTQTLFIALKYLSHRLMQMERVSEEG